VPRPPRVVHLIPKLFGAAGGVFGGAERYALELARHMARAVPTRLVTFGDRPGRLRDGELSIRVVRGRAVRGQADNPFGWGLFREVLGAEVVHCHQQRIVASSAAAALGRLTGRRVFVSDLGGGGWDVSAYVSTDRWYRGHLHISEYSRAVYGHGGREWAHVIFGGVDTEKFSPGPPPTPHPLPHEWGEGQGWGGGPVLYVGRLLPHKGVNDLVEAVPPDLPLEVIGRPYHPRFYADLKALAAGKAVRFVHDCEDGGLVAAYRRALCLVLPSVYRDLYGQETRVPELLGQTLLEAMACGTPAVCTDVASMPEVVEDGVTGFVVPSNDPAALREKLCWLRDHPREARAMGEAGRRHVLNKFTWPAVVRRCLDIYAA
jgi:glycosyltransferase involved in cell wall biosynthesis